ncbi:hypothetical protein C479_10905 [Halovivax asiaticus JCM 14624]|uniref:Uncharacterized protein n=1 Tax=Halovivax asiaticus JCM 14624 TaxID=1227490 RepID=M0BEQ5_9EURY|nr:DUF5809 family protein [Halovivax asiaticus]ELZ09325.1 hypothetical protein C479_10905 [Halovivax asiaticus JCM 14624]
MERRGLFAPETIDEAREYFDAVGPAAQTSVREAARVMGFGQDEYRDRVTSEVVTTARDATFASLLEVTVADRETFDDWRAAYDGDVQVNGHEAVDNVVWHAGPTNQAVAATFQDEPDAAVATLRRQAFGRIYRELFEE